MLPPTPPLHCDGRINWPAYLRDIEPGDSITASNLKQLHSRQVSLIRFGLHTRKYSCPEGYVLQVIGATYSKPAILKYLAKLDINQLRAIRKACAANGF